MHICLATCISEVAWLLFSPIIFTVDIWTDTTSEPPPLVLALCSVCAGKSTSHHYPHIPAPRLPQHLRRKRKKEAISRCLPADGPLGTPMRRWPVWQAIMCMQASELQSHVPRPIHYITLPDLGLPECPASPGPSHLSRSQPDHRRRPAPARQAPPAQPTIQSPSLPRPAACVPYQPSSFHIGLCIPRLYLFPVPPPSRWTAQYISAVFFSSWAPFIFFPASPSPLRLVRVVHKLCLAGPARCACPADHSATLLAPASLPLRLTLRFFSTTNRPDS